MNLTDTILALSSPPTAAVGEGGPGNKIIATRAILRLSGPDAWHLAAKILPLPTPLAVGYHNDLPLPLLHPTIKLAAALLFKSPHSFTGQDIAELHLPASPSLLRAVTDELLTLGEGRARPADPGEFSARAFFNQKIDLTQAEGIAATIHAADQSERRAAESLRQGQLHRTMNEYAERIARLLALVEAGIDFTDEEDISFVDSESLLSELSQLECGLHYLIAHAVRVDRISEPPSVVFIGQPNVGKSSLINSLSQSSRSITSDVAGTTRDMLSIIMPTPRGDIRLIDVPGEEPPSDELRTKMMAVRDLALLEADLIVKVVTHPTQVISGLAILGQFSAYAVTVQNKVDLLPPGQIRTFEFIEDDASFMTFRGDWQMVSAKTGFNIQQLRDEIITLATRRSPISANLPALNQRHRAILQQVKIILGGILAHNDFDRHPELLAAELRRALDLLGQITGTISPDEILGRIFATFCIGK